MMNKTYYEYYKDSPELMAQGFTSAYIAGLVASKSINSDMIDQIIWDKEMQNRLVSKYIYTLNSIHPTYLGKAD